MVGLNKYYNELQTRLQMQKVANLVADWIFLADVASQGAGEGVDPGQKMPTSETCVFGSGHAWGSTFISSILCTFLEAP